MKFSSPDRFFDDFADYVYLSSGFVLTNRLVLKRWIGLRIIERAT
jgi:hypothetical protein